MRFTTETGSVYEVDDFGFVYKNGGALSFRAWSMHTYDWDKPEDERISAGVQHPEVGKGVYLSRPYEWLITTNVVEWSDDDTESES